MYFCRASRGAWEHIFGGWEKTTLFSIIPLHPTKAPETSPGCLLSPPGFWGRVGRCQHGELACPITPQGAGEGAAPWLVLPDAFNHCLLSQEPGTRGGYL